MGASQIVGVLNGEQTDRLRELQGKLRQIEAIAVKLKGSPDKKTKKRS